MGLENIIAEALPEVLTTQTRFVNQLGAEVFALAGNFRTGLLRHRNDERYLFTQ